MLQKSAFGRQQARTFGRRFEVLAAILMILVFLGVTPCIIGYNYQRFEKAFASIFRVLVLLWRFQRQVLQIRWYLCVSLLGVISQRSQPWSFEWFIQYNVNFRWKWSKLRHFIITAGFCNEMPGEREPTTFHLGILTLRGDVRCQQWEMEI